MKSSEVEELADSFIETFGEPITNAAEFYSYYYLAEVKGEKQFGFDLNGKSERLADDFYYYSVFATSKELHDIDAMVSVTAEDGKERTFGSWKRARKRKMMKDILPEIRDEYGEGVMERFRQIVYEKPETVATYNETKIKNFCDEVQELWSGFSNPQEFLQAAELLFNIDETLSDYVQEVEWTGSFGGRAWESVASMAGRRDEFTDVTYTDLMWSIEHNNELFINKVPVMNYEYKKVKEYGSQYEPDGGLVNASKSENDMYHVLAGLLDDAREGDMYYVMEFASKDDPNIRNYVRRMEKPELSAFKDRAAKLT